MSTAPDRIRVFLRLRMAPVRHQLLARTAGELLDLVTIAGNGRGPEGAPGRAEGAGSSPAQTATVGVTASGKRAMISMVLAPAELTGFRAPARPRAARSRGQLILSAFRGSAYRAASLGWQILAP